MFCEKDTGNESSLRDVHVQVSDEDGYLSRNMTFRAISNDDSQSPTRSRKSEFGKSIPCFASKQQDRERIWINPDTSKIMKQPLESDTDAQLHKERAITVRKAAEFASRVPHKKCPR